MTEYELTDIELVEISAVDRGANQHAHVVLCKHSGYNADVNPQNGVSETRGDGSVTVEELTERLAKFQSQVADLTARAESAETALAKMSQSAKSAGLDIVDGAIAKRAEPEYVTVNGVRIEKSSVSEPVLALLTAQAAEIAKMAEAAESVELAKRGATELPHLGGTPLAKGRLLKMLADDADLLRALHAADAAMKNAYVEKGHAAVEDTASPLGRLESMAKQHQQVNGGSFEAAYAAITGTPEGAALLSQHRTAARAN